MRFAVGLALLISCSHQKFEVSPSWVSAVRNGDESLKVTYGSKTYYRRIAGSKEISKESSCELAITRAEEDIKKEFPNVSKVPYSLEVLFYDEQYSDCAVTVSVVSNLKNRYDDLQTIQTDILKRKSELETKNNVTEDEATEILQMRADMASRYALTGLTKDEFEKFSKDKVFMNEEVGICNRFFKTNSFSTHGSTQICWRGENILGYCTLKDSQCWTRTP